MNNDRLFIDKFDNFIFTFRRMLFFGDTNSKIQHGNPKHDRNRLINFFFDEENDYYDLNSNTINFSETEKLKELFSEIYSYKAMSTTEMADSFLIFTELDSEKEKTVRDMCFSGRNQKNINRRLEKGSELAESGSIIIKDGRPRAYKKNCDICDGLTDDEKTKLLLSLDFAIKKNPFSAFASTYKSLVENRDNIDAFCSIDIDHQLFHPILDEIHIWTAISAISERRNVNIKYCSQNNEMTEVADVNSVLPLRIVYDSLYGRSYLIAYDNKYNNYSIIRFDRIYHMEIAESADPLFFHDNINYVTQNLQTAWLVDITSSPKTVELEFDNYADIYSRVKNEGRHGEIVSKSDSHFIYRISVNSPKEMINWILSFGEYCKVVKPDSLKNEIIVRLERMASGF